MEKVGAVRSLSCSHGRPPPREGHSTASHVHGCPLFMVAGVVNFMALPEERRE